MYNTSTYNKHKLLDGYYYKVIKLLQSYKKIVNNIIITILQLHLIIMILYGNNNVTVIYQ